MDVFQKLSILSSAAKFDASCATSGTQRPGTFPGARFGNAVSGGICHSFADDGRCIALLKVLFTNACVNDCAYCVNRRSADVPRASFTVEELVSLTESFYRRNYIEGLFLSSAVYRSPDATMELLIRTVRSLRTDAGFNGYVHLKIIPGASPETVREAGLWADRISANIELPSEKSLKALAPEKSGHDIFSAMASIKRDIDVNQEESRWRRLLSVSVARSGDRGLRAMYGGAAADRADWAALAGPEKKAIAANAAAPPAAHPSPDAASADAAPPAPRRAGLPWGPRPTLETGVFAPSGQSTQLIVGASPESDRKILSLTEVLYGRFRLRRVYYSAYVPVHADARLPLLPAPPLRREHRLYQADWLLRFYGFRAEEILTDDLPFLDLDLDPKCAWALRHMDRFPVEVMRADYESLLRVPGLGQKSAEKIVQARRHGGLTFDVLKKIGVVLKRARYFILCNGKTLETDDLPAAAIRAALRQADGTGSWGDGQLPLFGDPRALPDRDALAAEARLLAAALPLEGTEAAVQA